MTWGLSTCTSYIHNSGKANCGFWLAHQSENKNGGELLELAHILLIFKYIS